MTTALGSTPDSMAASNENASARTDDVQNNQPTDDSGPKSTVDTSARAEETALLCLQTERTPERPSRQVHAGTYRVGMQQRWQAATRLIQNVTEVLGLQYTTNTAFIQYVMHELAPVIFKAIALETGHPNVYRPQLYDIQDIFDVLGGFTKTGGQLGRATRARRTPVSMCLHSMVKQQGGMAAPEGLLAWDTDAPLATAISSSDYICFLYVYMSTFRTEVMTAIQSVTNYRNMLAETTWTEPTVTERARAQLMCTRLHINAQLSNRPNKRSRSQQMRSASPTTARSDDRPQP